MSNKTNSRPGKDYLILDTESVWCWESYNRYAASDPKAAPPRWTMRKIVSASLLDLRIDDGELSHVSLKSLPGFCEETLVPQLFDELLTRPNHRLVSFGGLNAEQPILEMAAMRLHLKLPLALRKGEKFERFGDYRHLDLAQSLKGGGSYCHLAEISSALDHPFKCAGSADRVELLAAHRCWKSIAEISEIDTVSTGLALLAWLGANGLIDHPLAKQISLLKQVIERPEVPSYIGDLREAHNRMTEQLCSSAWKAAA
jgi:hypothetical protein